MRLQAVVEGQEGKTMQAVQAVVVQAVRGSVGVCLNRCQLPPLHASRLHVRPNPWRCQRIQGGSLQTLLNGVQRLPRCS